MLTDLGRYAEARAAYEDALTTAKELDDLRITAVANIRLGPLVLQEGDLPEARWRYGEALDFFQRLKELANEAVSRHQLAHSILEGRGSGANYSYDPHGNTQASDHNPFRYIDREQDEPTYISSKIDIMIPHCSDSSARILSDLRR